MDIITRTLSYTTLDGTTLQSYLCLPKETSDNNSGILVAPEWWGLSQHAKQAAERLAEAGYAALAMDLYGDGRLTNNAAEANEWMSAVLADPDTLTERTNLALTEFGNVAEVDHLNLGAIGFCFGGKVVLDMARRGAPLKGVVSFHGNLTPAIPAMPGMVKAEILIEHAGKDTMVSMDDLARFEQEMNAAGVRYHVDIFDAKHGFTNPQATANGEKNGIDLAYDEEAAASAWQNMLNFFDRIL